MYFKPFHVFLLRNLLELKFMETVLGENIQISFVFRRPLEEFLWCESRWANYIVKFMSRHSPCKLPQKYFPLLFWLFLPRVVSQPHVEVHEPNHDTFLSLQCILLLNSHLTHQGSQSMSVMSIVWFLSIFPFSCLIQWRGAFAFYQKPWFSGEIHIKKNHWICPWFGMTDEASSCLIRSKAGSRTI